MGFLVVGNERMRNPPGAGGLGRAGGDGRLVILLSKHSVLTINEKTKCVSVYPRRKESPSSPGVSKILCFLFSVSVLFSQLIRDLSLGATVLTLPWTVWLGKEQGRVRFKEKATEK